jgi:Tol biopolymer transport system component
MRRRLVVLVATAMTLFGLVGVTEPAQAKPPGPNGRIAFARQATPPVGEHGHVVYTVDPDGSHLQELAQPGDIPRWSPDGTEISIDDADCFSGGVCAAVIFNADTGSSRVLPGPGPLFNEWFGCDTWSPDGTRLACGGFSDSPGVSGVYTIRSSDGGGLTKVLSCDEVQPGAICGPGDYSPDGERLVVGVEEVALFVVRLNGSELRQITPTGTLLDEFNGRWSPSGDHILFVAQPDADHRRAIFVVNSDGTGLHQVPIPGCGGALSDPTSVSCFGPDWSPDGTKIVFVRASARFHVQNVYTVNADGSGLFQATYESGGLEVTSADWGTHPLAP